MLGGASFPLSWLAPGLPELHETILGPWGSWDCLGFLGASEPLYLGVPCGSWRSLMLLGLLGALGSWGSLGLLELLRALGFLGALGLLGLLGALGLQGLLGFLGALGAPGAGL